MGRSATNKKYYRRNNNAATAAASAVAADDDSDEDGYDNLRDEDDYDVDYTEHFHDDGLRSLTRSFEGRTK